MENPREMQVDELKLGHIAFGVNVSDLGGEIVRLTFMTHLLARIYCQHPKRETYKDKMIFMSFSWE